MATLGRNCGSIGLSALRLEKGVKLATDVALKVVQGEIRTGP